MKADERSSRNDRLKLRERIRSRGIQLGFVRVGFADARRILPHDDALQRWIDAGMHGEMDFIRRSRRQRSDPRRLLPGAKTLIVAVARYARGATSAPSPADHGRIASYARGLDYHLVIRARLEQLAADIERMAGCSLDARVAVDTLPLLEREAAMAAGVGFIGKNTLLITPGIGSFTVLGELLLSLPLPADTPARARCGDCDRCLAACPTGALVKPWTVDSRRCIAYLTIEHRGTIDPSLVGRTADWVFGCDACQLVCPYNVLTPTKLALPPDGALDGSAAAEASLPASLPLADLLALRSSGHKRLVRQRALRRTPAAAMRRNAALAAAACQAGRASDELVAALRLASSDDDPGLRQLASLALQRLAQHGPD